MVSDRTAIATVSRMDSVNSRLVALALTAGRMSGPARNQYSRGCSSYFLDHECPRVKMGRMRLLENCLVCSSSFVHSRPCSVPAVELIQSVFLPWHSKSLSLGQGYLQWIMFYNG